MRSDCPWVIREDDRSILRFRIATFPPDIPGDCGRRNREPLPKCCHPVPNQPTVPAPAFRVGRLRREVLAPEAPHAKCWSRYSGLIGHRMAALWQWFAISAAAIAWNIRWESRYTKPEDGSVILAYHPRAI